MNIHWKDWCWSWNSNTLATWYEELTYLKRPWCWERLKAGGEGDDRRWDGWMVSLIQRTWIWISSGSWWWTGRPGVLQSMESQRVEHNWVTELMTDDIKYIWKHVKIIYFFKKMESGYKNDILCSQLVQVPSSLVVKIPPAMQETWIQSLGQKDSPGEENGNPLQYSCLKNSMEKILIHKMLNLNLPCHYYLHW